MLAFVGSNVWGKPADRRRDIYAAFDRIALAPFAQPIRKWSRRYNLGLRCYRVRQFVIVYGYIGDVEKYPNGEISIRALKHRRVRNLLHGVTESVGSSGTQPLLTSDGP
jgi:hypothetical protein